MFEVTPQERTALVVIATLIAGGAVARHAVNRAEAREWLAYTAEAGDSLDPSLRSGLRDRVAAEVELQRIRSEPLGPDERLDPNRAPPEQLDRLPRVGPALAARIVADRETAGPYRTLEDLGRVSGIGPAMLEAIRPHIALASAAGRAAGGAGVRGATGTGGSPAALDRASAFADGGGPGSGSSGEARIEINRATAAELTSLPGVGPAIAERIVEYRRAHGPFATFAELEQVSGIGPRLRERIEAVARLGS